jgi:hypothetical protein
MPGNTKKRRRKKGRGTQGGRISDRPVGRPRNRAEARQRAQQRRAAAKGGKAAPARAAKGAGGGRTPQPPSWKGAIQKGVLASLLFFALFAFLFKRPVAASAALALFTLAFYVPLSYYLDGFMYRRYQSNLERDRQQAAQARQAPQAEDGDDAG